LGSGDAAALAQRVGLGVFLLRVVDQGDRGARQPRQQPGPLRLGGLDDGAAGLHHAQPDERDAGKHHGQHDEVADRPQAAGAVAGDVAGHAVARRPERLRGRPVRQR
jgi:hypothetical protein